MARGAKTYSDADLADYYDGLGYAGTFQLVVRDLSEIIARHVNGGAALDFACGCGRSTRYLKGLGFDTVGVDVSQAMLANAQRRDPEGRYFRVGNGDLSSLTGYSFNLAFSAFPFASTTTQKEVRAILAELKRLLNPDGCLIVVEPTDALYRHEWLSFSTLAFPENVNAKSGDPVPIHFRDRMDQPVVDILWTDEDYQRSFEAVGLSLLEAHRPIARPDDLAPWISERDIPPWVIYVLVSVKSELR